eukprot:6177232-Pleurochrysis_carterae.AAC.2
MWIPAHPLPQPSAGCQQSPAKGRESRASVPTASSTEKRAECQIYSRVHGGARAAHLAVAISAKAPFTLPTYEEAMR